MNQEPELLTEAEFKERFPDYAHTWEWNEHPNDYSGICACADCRSVDI